jgi:hypothetical protein
MLAGLTLAAVGLAVLAGDAPAQQYNPYFRPGGYKGPGPTISPYLNLLRGRNAAVNYYFGVQPFTDPRSPYLQSLLGEERLVPEAAPGQEDLFPKLPQTGHPVGFQNYGGYFNQPGAVTSPVVPSAGAKGRYRP